MDVVQAVQNIRAHIEQDIASARERLESDLPGVAEFVQAAAANPVTQALAAAVHLNSAPELLQGFAQMISLVESRLAAAHDAGVSEGQAAAQPPADTPAA